MSMLIFEVDPEAHPSASLSHISRLTISYLAAYIKSVHIVVSCFSLFVSHLHMAFMAGCRVQKGQKSKLGNRDISARKCPVIVASSA